MEVSLERRKKGRMAVIQDNRKYFTLMGLSRVGVRGLASL